MPWEHTAAEKTDPSVPKGIWGVCPSIRTVPEMAQFESVFSEINRIDSRGCSLHICFTGAGNSSDIRYFPTWWSSLHLVILPVLPMGLLMRVVANTQIKFYFISKETVIDFPWIPYNHMQSLPFSITPRVDPHPLCYPDLSALSGFMLQTLGFDTLPPKPPKHELVKADVVYSQPLKHLPQSLHLTYLVHKTSSCCSRAWACFPHASKCSFCRQIKPRNLLREGILKWRLFQFSFRNLDC